MISRKGGVPRGKGYEKKGEGKFKKGFSLAESSPTTVRDNANGGNPKDVQAAWEADTSMSAKNITPSFDDLKDAARARAARY